MPKLSPFRYQDKKARAIKLYKQGLTLREVGNMVKMSHTWVWNHVKHLSTIGGIDKE